MNRKLRLFMLILMLTLFAHGTVYAADEKESGADAPVAVETSVSPDTTEGKDESNPTEVEAAETEPASKPEVAEASPAEAEAATEEKDPCNRTEGGGTKRPRIGGRCSRRNGSGR